MLRLCLGLIMLLTIYTYSQEYDWLYPVPQGNNINKIKFFDTTYGFAVGDAGTIIATNDGGESWDMQYEAITGNILDVAVLDSLTAVAVGENGLAIKTTDGGYAWLDMNISSQETLTKVVFVDKLHGWICGSARTLFHTNDGGATWTKQLQSPGASIDITGMDFADVNNGWFSTLSGLIYHTTNAGTSWTMQKNLAITCNQVRFYSALLGMVACDNGTVALTKDGGTTWSTVSTGQTGIIFDILFVSASEIWGAVETGKLIHSTDGGATWTITTINGYSSFFSLAKMNSGIFAAGEYGVIMEYTPDYSGWYAIANPTDNSANWITFANANTGYAVGQYGFIAKTSNKGITWSAIDNKVTMDSFYGASAVGDNNCWVVGDAGVILHTSDGGAGWAQQETGLTTSLVTVSFVSNLIGWAAGDAGAILHTTNGGTTWTKQTSNTSNYLLGIYFADANKGWCVGANGTIMRTTNGGSTWITTSSVVSSSLYSVNMINSSLGFSAGPSGVILRTTDSGASWAKVTSGVTTNLALVAGSSANNLFAVGDTGTVLYSTDSGTSWTAQFASTYNNLYGAALVDTVLYICGDNSSILTNSYAQLTDVRESSQLHGSTVPVSFTLLQNYPNPFNPSTTIQYELQKSGWVHLKVFDVVGRLVASPVHKEESIGTHAFRFNAVGLPSGVYYYTLSLNGTMQTRKMILLK